MHNTLATIRLRGTTPLMLNKMPEEVLLGLRNKGQKKKYVAPPDPRDEAATKYHQLPDGTPIIPAEMLMACLISAGTFIKLDGKRQMSTAKSTLLPGFLSLEEPYSRIYDPKASIDPKRGEEYPNAEFEVDIRQGRNPNGGEAVCLVRPMFHSWAVDVKMTLDTESLAEQVYRNLIDIAGTRYGLGDFRPQCKGIFGKFQVGCWSTEERPAELAVDAAD